MAVFLFLVKIAKKWIPMDLSYGCFNLSKNSSKTHCRSAKHIEGNLHWPGIFYESLLTDSLQYKGFFFRRIQLFSPELRIFVCACVCVCGGGGGGVKIKKKKTTNCKPGQKKHLKKK